jgi:RNA polymerase sigma factor (sigma-70 family)
LAEPTDRELVILTRQGNKEAFGCLIERYLGLMERIALRMVSAPDAAQDLVQESMLQAFLSLKDLRDVDRFRSWLYGIVLNVSKSYLRDQKRQTCFNEVLDDDQPVGLWSSGNASNDPQEIAVERELHNLVLLAIEELPQAHREAARLYYYESLSLLEIAAITGASPGAIKVRLHRARNHLRDKLQPTYPEIGPEKTRKYRRKTMIKAKIVDIVKRDNNHIVILQDESQGKLLPIWIGPFEAEAIVVSLCLIPVARPQTHDFIVHLLAAFGGQLEEVRVEVIKDEVFYGIAKIRIGNEIKEVDARPSDILALAVRTGTPIYIAEEVMQQSGQDINAYENTFGPFTPGEGVESILKHFKEMKKRVHTPCPEEKDSEASKDK